MHFSTTAVVLFTTFASSVLAHMELVEPPPFRGKGNPNLAETSPDFDMTTPLAPSGENFPCKGYHSDLGKPQGAPTAEYEAGSQHTLKIGGGAPHNGGSCQISLSYDQGATFKVIKSIIGNCVDPQGSNEFPFTIPADAQSGEAILSWSWINHTGNREFYMNCAPVSITGSGTSKLADAPDMMVANLAITTCKVAESVDVIYPNPGQDVTENDTGNLGEPTGDCGTAAGGGSPPAEEDPAPPAGGAPVEETPVEEAPVEEEPVEEDPSPPEGGEETEPTPDDQCEAEPVEEDPPQEDGEETEPTPDECDADPVDDDEDTPAATQPGTVVVAAGDTCISIGEEHGVSADQIMANNVEINSGCTNLKPGQVLQLRKRSRIMGRMAW